MKISKIVAKSLIRIFFLLMLVILASYIFHFGAFNSLDVNQHDNYVTIRNKWVLIYPGLLLLGFIILLVLAQRNKFSKTDINWLLVLNTAILMTYIILWYIRLYQLFNPKDLYSVFMAFSADFLYS